MVRLTSKLNTLEDNQNCPCSRSRLEKGIRTFLLAHRNTPHSTTGVSLAELLFKISTKLLELDSVIKKETDEAVRNQDRAKKECRKLDTDQKKKRKRNRTGNKVLLQQKRQGKLTSFCEPEPYNVVEKDESQVLIKSPAGDQYKRNVAHTS